MSEAHKLLSVSSLAFCVIVLVALFLGHLINHLGWYHVPESGVSMIFGALIALFLLLLPAEDSKKFLFSSDFFFFVLLPPIVFEAGISLKRKDFFRNISSILTFAILGTIISTIIIAFGMYLAAYNNWIPLLDEEVGNNALECLLFGAAISATDPVGTLAVLGRKELNIDPTLYSLIFGESVLNDAVSIVLYQIFYEYQQQSVVITFQDHLFSVIGKFLWIMIGSIIVGIICALLCSFILKNFYYLASEPSIQYVLVLLFGYISYNLGETFELSGIVSVFFCGIYMGHYAWYNLSWVAQVSVNHVVKSISHSCENFVFVYLGMAGTLSMVSNITGFEWHFMTILIALILLFISRACNIFPLGFLLNMRRQNKIPKRMMIFMWFAGLRGAIAFALALKVDTPHSGIIITTTISIVFATTLFCGLSTLRVLEVLDLRGKPEVSVPDLNEINNNVTTNNNNSNPGSAESLGIFRDSSGNVLTITHLPSTNEIISNAKHNEDTSELPMSTSLIASAYLKIDKSKIDINDIKKKKSTKIYTGLQKKWNDFDHKYLMNWFGGSGVSKKFPIQIINPYNYVNYNKSNSNIVRNNYIHEIISDIEIDDEEIEEEEEEEEEKEQQQQNQNQKNKSKEKNKEKEKEEDEELQLKQPENLQKEE